MKEKRTRRGVFFLAGVVACVCAFLSLFGGVLVAAPDEVGDHLLFSNANVREADDQAWTLRVRGQVPSLAGCYLLVHDARGNLVLKTHVPHGDYTGAHPLDLAIPKDGWAGDYRILVVGREADVRGLDLPLTDLKFEVYGRTLFATRSKGPLWFRAEAGETPQEFSGHKGSMKVLEGGGQPLVGPLQPGKLYTLDTTGTFYFNAKPGAYLSFSSDRIFSPNPKLAEISWWQLVNPALKAGKYPAPSGDLTTQNK